MKRGYEKGKGIIEAQKLNVSSEVNLKRNKNQRITMHVGEKWDDHDDVVEGKNGNSRG